MRILLCLHTPRFARYYEDVIRDLQARGHELTIALGRADLGADVLATLDLDVPVVQRPKRGDGYGYAALGVRTGIDYARYLDPRFADAAFLRGRARGRAVELLPPLALLERAPRALRRRPRLLLGPLLAAERAIPSSAELEAFIRAQEAEVVLVSPLVNFRSWETDLVKSASALGVPSAALIASWDNLTTKGHLRVVPDRVMVWNAAQRQEAVELHGVPAERVVVTGAPVFDRWFGRRPSTPRDAFCARAGLDPARPFVLYVGSTSNINAPDWEDAFIRRWVAALRAHGGALADLQVLVRPHPDRRGAYVSDPLADLPDAAVWPPERPSPADPGDRAGFFDSLFHSAAVVGVNTSAMIEAAIVGRPVLTIRVDDFAQAQSGTLHFDHLRAENGGFLVEGRDLREHAAQLAGALGDPEATRDRLAAFVASFVRPFGREVAAGPRMVQAIEALGTLRPEPAGMPARRRPLAAVLRRYDAWLRRRLEEDATPPARRGLGDRAERRLPAPARRRMRAWRKARRAARKHAGA